MMHEVVKSRIEDKHFGIPIHKRDYPSCYQYNVLIMLAKRLLREEKEKTNILSIKSHLEKKLIKRILNSEKRELDLIC